MGVVRSLPNKGPRKIDVKMWFILTHFFICYIGFCTKSDLQ